MRVTRFLAALAIVATLAFQTYASAGSNTQNVVVVPPAGETAPDIVRVWKGIWAGGMARLRLTFEVTRQWAPTTDCYCNKVAGTLKITGGKHGTETYEIEGAPISYESGEWRLKLVDLSTWRGSFEFTVSANKLDGRGYGGHHKGPLTLTPES